MKLATIVGLICFALLALMQPLQRGAAAYAFVPPARGVQPLPSRATGQGQLPRMNPFAGTIFGGKFVYTISIAVKSSIPSADVIACTGNASTFDGTFKSIAETASVAAARSGATASCTVTIPYSWSLSASSTDVVTLGYQITAPATGAAGLPSRYSNQTIAQIHVPPSGSTTTEVISATI